jgi:signal transduction histidine kinase/ActR/RegA family two-component response regulator/sensor domain CHASE-containing protein
MTIKTKLITLFIIILLVTTFFLIYYDLLQKKGQNLYYSNDLTQRKIVLHSFFQNRKNNFLRLADDYSLWNELITFLQQPESDWAQEYIEPILYIHGNDVVWIFDESYNRVFFASEFEDFASYTFDSSLFSHLEANKLSHFFLPLENDVVEFGAATIHATHDNERQTQPAGFILFGKRYNERFLSELENQMNYHISWLPPVELNDKPDSLIDMVLKFNLMDYQSESLGTLRFYQHNSFLESLQDIHHKTLIFLFFCAAFFLSGLYLLFHFWIQKPLFIIAKSLQTKEHKKLRQIAEQENEFGKIGTLILHYFEQTERLRLEMEERLKAKQLLLETSDRFYKIFQHSPDMIIITNEHVILEANEAFWRETEMEVSGVIGKHIHHLGMFPSEITTLPEKKNTLISLKTKTGKILETLVSLENIEFNQKKCTLYMFRNITEEMKLEKKMIQAQKMEAVSSLAAGIAHDFNNILNIIMGYTATLKRKTMPNSEQFEKLSLIENASHRAHDLVEQIVLIGKKHEQIYQPVKLSSVLQQALKFLRPSIPATIELQISIRSEAYIHANPTQLHHLIINICTNAYQAIENESGRIEIILSEKVLPQFNLPYLNLQIADTGCGISEKMKDKIFDPYFSTKDSQIGLGLGLAVVKGIVDSCNGFIEVESEIGKGSIFDFYFPIVPVEDKHAILPEKIAVVRHKTVLFVEDEEELLSLFQESLIDADFDVITASDSRKALDLYFEHKNSIDIIISDASMPKMSGIEMITKIRHFQADIPIILYSGFKTVEIEKALKELNIFAFLLKPIIPEKMVETIFKALTNDR